MTEDVVVVGTTAGVDQEEAVGVGDPVLLGVVGAQLFAVVKGPGLGFVEVESVAAAGDVALHIVAEGKEKSALVFGEGGLGKTALHGHGVHAAVLHVGEGVAVEAGAHHGGAVLLGVFPLEINGQQDVAIGQVDALGATGAVVEEVGLVGHLHVLPSGPGARFGIVDRIGGRPCAVGVDELIVLVIHGGVARAQELAGGGVPLGGEVTDDRCAAVTIGDAPEVFVLGGPAPGLATVVGPHFVEGVENIRATQEELLHGEHHRGRFPRDGPRTGMDPAGLFVEARTDGLQLNIVVDRLDGHGGE